VVLLARHGKRHQISPAQVNYRANICALKDQGVTHILATTACGSLREEIGRGDFVIVDQFIDFTRQRRTTFFDSFEDGAHHTAMADPFDAGLRRVLYEACLDLGFRVHDGGTLITIEGPRFSTRAESNMFRVWGADVINMSVAPEAALANEAGIPYAAVAMSTDYDCWKRDEAPVTWDEILAVFQRNADRVHQVLTHAIGRIGSSGARPRFGAAGNQK
jgi:5'-methylthioadenosine phosphorylase